MDLSTLPRWPSVSDARRRAEAVWNSRPRQLSLDLTATIEVGACWTCDGAGERECGHCGGKGCRRCDRTGAVACGDCAETGEEQAVRSFRTEWR